MATDDGAWEQELYPRLKRLYPDDAQRGKLKDLLLSMSPWLREQYFKGNDIEVMAALNLRLRHSACGQGSQGQTCKRRGWDLCHDRDMTDQYYGGSSEAGYEPRGT